ncbi:hypothetical protein GCM10010417_06650 [Streptomyces carpaticus]
MSGGAHGRDKPMNCADAPGRVLKHAPHMHGQSSSDGWPVRIAPGKLHRQDTAATAPPGRLHRPSPVRCRTGNATETGERDTGGRRMSFRAPE